MAELRALNATDVRALLSDVLAQPHDHVSAERWAYREASALLGAFDGGTLHANRSPGGRDALREFLTGDCERVSTPSGNQWRLLDRVREETVRRLSTPKRLLETVADVPPNPDDPGREMAVAYLRGDRTPLEDQTLAQLHGTLQAISWLAPAKVAMPSADEVQGRLALVSLLQPLKKLVGSHFVGRTTELARLAEYVEVLPAGSTRSRVRRGLRRVFDLSEKPPLVIHAPGGMGKSTLVAKFVLDHIELGRQRRFPFAYLTFDRADLVADQPLSLLAESSRQLRAQYPEIAPEAQSLEEAVRSNLVSVSAVEREVAPVMMKQSRASIETTGRDDAFLISRYARLVDKVLDDRELPILWILDTFERAQHGTRAVGRLWEFLDQLQSEVPRLRVVFAGRAPIDGHATDDMVLTGFDGELALAFLHQQLPDMQLSETFLRSVAGQVGANPLSLMLASELLRSEGETALRKVQTRRKLLFRLGAEEIQAVLYRRVLDHLRDPDVRAIANPGLVVRRVTPDVIARVLAGPCGLKRVDDEKARAIFDKLTREMSLIEPVGPGVVLHRADVRAVMLPLLERADPAKVAKIHRAAVAYYEEQTSIEAKTEELYHRLSLGQSTKRLDRAWNPRAASQLEPALDELPPAGRVYLADKLGITLDASVITAADDEAWARGAGRLARDHLDSGDPEGAITVIHQREGRRVPLALTSLEIEALAMLGRTDDALAVVDTAVKVATDEVQSAAFVQVSVLGARVAEDAGRFDTALERAYDARDIAGALGDRILSLAAGVAALRLHRRSGTTGSTKCKKLRVAVIEEARGLSSNERARNPSLVRDLAAEIGSDAPDIVADAAKLVGIDVKGDAAGTLEKLLSSDAFRQFGAFLRDATETAPDDEVGLDSLADQTTTEQGQHLSDFLKSDVDTDSWTVAVSEVYQEAADRPAFER